MSPHSENSVSLAVKTIPYSPELHMEIRTFESEANRFLDGELEPQIFQPFRLLQGIYGQRQDDVQMVRMKVPLGRLTPDQLRAAADVADEFSDGRLHVTTRQDFQMYWVPLDQVGAVLRRLAASGLSTREACGNTVRNVTAAHDAGVSPDDVFNIIPWATAVTDHFLRSDLVQALPRKFKISFSGNSRDHAIAAIHDIGAVAVQRTANGVPEYGFRVTAGGGLGRSPYMAQLLEEFVPLPDVLPLFHAILTVFNKYGNRKNMAQARMKFLVEKLGLDEFKQRIQTELDAIRSNPALKFRTPDVDVQLPPADQWKPAESAALSSNPAFQLWYRDNVTAERSRGFYSALITLKLGDISSSQTRIVADLVERYSHDVLINTITQNMLIRSVREADLAPLFGALQAAGLGAAGAHRIDDVVSCPGADTCRLGITSSRGLGAALKDHLAKYQQDEDLRNISVKISGCPNSCGQHHIASIGLHGVGKQSHGQIAPHYLIHLGGKSDADGTRVNVPLAKIPVKKVPAAVDELIRYYREHRNENETFADLMFRTSKTELSELLAPYTEIPAVEENAEHYIDWGRDEQFSTKGVGSSECGVKELEEVVKRLAAAERQSFQAQVFLELNDPAQAFQRLESAIQEAVRGILATSGEEIAGDDDALRKFQYTYIDTGVLPDTFLALRHTVLDLKGKSPDEYTVSKYLKLVRRFVEEIQAYQRQLKKQATKEMAA